MDREDCYWYVDCSIENEDERIMKAMCVECKESHDFGWFWPGREKGYGDYDLNCSICGKTLHRRQGEYE